MDIFETDDNSTPLTEEEKQQLEEYAKKNDLKMSQVVRRALREFFLKENLK